MLIHIVGYLIFHGNGIDGTHTAIGKLQLHAVPIHMKGTGQQFHFQIGMLFCKNDGFLTPLCTVRSGQAKTQTSSDNVYRRVLKIKP